MCRRSRHTETNSELYIYGTIGRSSLWESCISSKQVQELLTKISTPEINVHINSGGGDVFESIAIGNLLKNHQSNINIYIDGIAGSGASVVAMSGSKVLMPRNVMMMIHNAWTLFAGNANDFRKQAEDLDQVDIAVSESYMSRFNGSKEELLNLLAQESWLTADECLSYGLCDEILEDKKKENPNNLQQRSIQQNVDALFNFFNNLNGGIK